MKCTYCDKKISKRYVVYVNNNPAHIKCAAEVFSIWDEIGAMEDEEWEEWLETQRILEEQVKGRPPVRKKG